MLEVMTYPDARVIRQVVRETALVLLDRDVLPEVVVLSLHSKGNVEASREAKRQAAQESILKVLETRFGASAHNACPTRLARKPGRR